MQAENYHAGVDFVERRRRGVEKLTAQGIPNAVERFDREQEMADANDALAKHRRDHADGGSSEAQQTSDRG